MKISKGRFLNKEVQRYLWQIAQVMAYSKVALRAEAAIKAIFQSRKRFVKRGAGNERNPVGVYRLIRQKIKRYKKYLPGEIKRRETETVQRLIHITEEFLDLLHKRLEAVAPASNPAADRQRILDRAKRRMNRRKAV